MTDTSALHDLAQLSGILLEYWDVSGNRCAASEKSLLATLRALGVEIDRPEQAAEIAARRRLELLNRGIEPALVAWGEEPVTFIVTFPFAHNPKSFDISVALEDGGEQTWTFDWDHGEPVRTDNPDFVSKRYRTGGHHPIGYHDLTLTAGDFTAKSLLMVAPVQAWIRGENRRDWGVFLPLYALRSEHAAATGDFTDLETLGRWVGEHGGNLVGTLPILTSYLDDPLEPSPYSPVSRQFWNELFIDVERAPELEASPEAKVLLNSLETKQAIEAMRSAEMSDYETAWKLKRKVLEHLAAAITKLPEREKAFEQFLGENPDVVDYARFRAAREKLGHPWMNWPEQARNGELTDSDCDPDVQRMFGYAQFLCYEQIGEITHTLDMQDVELYLDLPLGVRGDGYDVWRNQSCFAMAASAGAPPDALYTNGQNWGFPPLHPEGIRENGYRHVRAFLRHHLSLCGRLRVDHVMGLHRLYWIPFEVENHEGVYVRYQPEEFYAILCIESHRQESIIIGENLGTVPPEVNEQMDRHRIRVMTVAEYEVEAEEMSWMDKVPGNSISSLNTHDMPPFAGWWRGDDILVRRDIGLLDDEAVEKDRHRREQIKANLVEKLRQTGHLDTAAVDAAQVTRALHRFLADSPTELVLLNAEDFWEETRPQNVPGTWKEHPNWQRKALYPIERWNQFTEVVETVTEVRTGRTGG